MNRLMRIRQKSRSAALASMLLVSIAATACSQSPSSSPSESPSSSGPAIPSSDPVMTIDWMQYPVLSTLDANSYAVQYLQKKFNVKLAIHPINYQDYAQKQQVQLSSGDIPDVMFVLSPLDLRKFAAQGILAEVPLETIQEAAPQTKSTLDQFAPQSWYYTGIDGKNYGLPGTYYNGQFATRVEWRTDLLKKAGIAKIPETIDEFTEAFAALKKIGVFGITTAGNSDYALFHMIFGAYGVLPMQWKVKDGKVVNDAVQPEAKQALALLADWYKQGYIDPEFVTGKDLNQKLIAGKVASYTYGNPNSVDPNNPNSDLSAARKINPEAAIELGTPPKGPGGQLSWSWGTAGNIWAFGKQLEHQPEKLKKILQIIETIRNDEQTYLDLYWGEKGKHWDYADSNLGNKGGLKFLAPYDDPNKAAADGIDGGSKGLNEPFALQSNPAFYEKYSSQDDLEAWKKDNYPRADFFGQPTILPSAAKIWPELQKLKIDSYMRIIIGEKPIDFFDDFAKQWNDKGGTQLEKEANELYQQMKK